jgi:hypothetical protein
MPPILAQNDFLLAASFGDLAACLAVTGGFKFMPCAFADARPLALSPPDRALTLFALPSSCLSHYFFFLRDTTILQFFSLTVIPAFSVCFLSWLYFCATVNFLSAITFLFFSYLR